MRFTINLATRTYLDNRMLSRLFAGAILLMSGYLAWNVSRVAGNFGEASRLQADISAYEARLNSKPVQATEKEFSQVVRSIKFYNDIIRRKSFDWNGLLEQVEISTPEGISLAALTPDAKTGDLKIEGRAKNFGQVRSYMDKLNENKSFSHVLLMSHDVFALNDRSSGIRFVITFRTAVK